jgi:hypothetical protein
MLFGQKEPYLIHLLRKKLGSELRKNLRQNLGENDIIIYTDFSKGYTWLKMVTLTDFTYIFRTPTSESRNIEKWSLWSQQQDIPVNTTGAVNKLSWVGGLPLGKVTAFLGQIFKVVLEFWIF